MSESAERFSVENVEVAVAEKIFEDSSEIVHQSDDINKNIEINIDTLVVTDASSDLLNAFDDRDKFEK